MEDAKLIQLHETLKKYQPRGKIGGLGFGGGAFGAPKKKDDSLPKNGLYAFFVRAGESGYKRWDDNEEEEPQQQLEASSKDEDGGKKKKSKKEKKAKKEGKRKREAMDPEPAPAPVKASKRLRSESVDQNPQEAEATTATTAAAAFEWEKHIKAALKGAEGQTMPVKALRRQVVALAKAHPEEGRQKKKALKQAFHGAVDAHAQLHLDADSGVVAYRKKKKGKKEEKAKAEVAVVAVAAVPVEKASKKKSQKDKKKRE